MRLGRGRFSHPNRGDTEEDKGRDGNNGTPDDRRSGEERDDGSALHATALNSLDSATHAYQRRLEGGGGGTTQWRRMTTATTGALSRNGAGRGEEHSATRRCLPTSLHREWIARAMRENRVVILAGSMGSGKSTQVPQFLLEEKEEKEDNLIDGGGGGSDNPCRLPDGIWEQ